MLYLLIGFGTGVWVGSYYNCKPYVEKLTQFAKDNLPEKKHNDNDNGNDPENKPK